VWHGARHSATGGRTTTEPASARPAIARLAVAGPAKDSERAGAAAASGQGERDQTSKPTRAADQRAFDAGLESR